MLKKCTPLWHEAHFEVKMLKKPGVRTICGSSDVASLHYTTLHYIKLHYTPLYYTPLHYTTLHNTTTTQLHNYTPLHSTTLHYTKLNHTTLHYTPLHYITLHCITFHYTSLHYTTLHYTPLPLQLQQSFQRSGLAPLFWRRTWWRGSGYPKSMGLPKMTNNLL